MRMSIPGFHAALQRLSRASQFVVAILTVLAG
jgi:hypothetical protein